jgi:translation initiation factor 3 subunit D
MSEFELNISFNPEGWGPINGERLIAFDEVPYAHFDKKEKCGKAADFVQQASAATMAYQKHPHYQKKRDAELAAAASTDFSYKHDSVEDSTFQLVDTSKTPSRRMGGGGRGRGGPGRGPQAGRFGGRGPTGRQDSSNIGSTQFQAQKGKAGGRFGGRNMGGRGYQRKDRKADRLPSLSIGGEWEMVEEFDLAQLLKLVANPPAVEDLLWAGHLAQYDDSYDSMTTRTQRIVKRIENKVFYDVTTGEDPILERFAVDNVGDVYATDTILAQLMAAPRSVYSWDIVIEKVNGVIFLDKRDNSSFDFLTVSETSLEPPSVSEETEEYNHPEKLSLEATMINQNFSQQVLFDKEATHKTYEPNPFFDDDNSGIQPASAAYRYRKFTLGSIRLVARTELQCWHNKKGEEQLMTCHAINEWDSKFSGGVNWRQKIDQQRGAVLAAELTNNSCKLAKWTAQALLSGAHQMKLGYVSRASPTNPHEHVILATQYFKPRDLAQQINLSINNIWGIVKMICELLMKKADGKFVLLKDPNKAIVRLYSIPIDSFEDEEEASGSEEEDGEKAADGETQQE